MVSSGILLSPEQLSMGGADTVRGYLEGERSGDRGLHGGLELQTPPLKWGGGLNEWALRGLAFMEGGQLSKLATTSTDAARYRLGRVGLGLRVPAPRGIAIDADLAYTLIQGESGGTPAQFDRLTVRAVWGY
jgi:hemolysin activation/secretion protein